MKRRDRAKFLYLLLGTMLLALTGCGGTDITLPTRMAQASLPQLAPTQASVDLPPTNTPPPNVTPLPTYGYRPIATIDPSPTGTIPTRTPTPTPTKTATPTRLPVSNLPAGNGGPGPNRPHIVARPGSRLGLHVVMNNDPRIMEFVRRTHPPVMKAVGDMGFLTEVKEVSPTTITIGRVDDIWAQNYIGEPEDAARDYVDAHLKTYRANPGVDFWEGWNEPDPGLSRMAWYARFEQERVKLMAQHGFRSAIGGFPPGVPEMDEFELFVPAIQTAIQYGGILTLHEGDLSTGDMRYGYGSKLPGYPPHPDRGTLAFRYRWFYEEILKPRGLVIPLVVSELEFATWNIIKQDELLPQLAWYDSEAQKDEYMLGFNVFTAGANQQWAAYNVNPILRDMASYANSQN